MERRDLNDGNVKRIVGGEHDLERHPHPVVDAALDSFRRYASVDEVFPYGCCEFGCVLVRPVIFVDIGMGVVEVVYKVVLVFLGSPFS